jgi:hypothetical protein
MTSNASGRADACTEMNEKTSKNTVDSAHPRPRELNSLTETEKKALELSERIEHSHGSRRENLTKAVQEQSKGNAD